LIDYNHNLHPNNPEVSNTMFRLPCALCVAALSAAIFLSAGCEQPTSKPAPVAENGQPDPGKQPNAPVAEPDNPQAAVPAAGTESDEKILPADKAPDDAPLRPMKGMPIYKLSNLQVGNFGPGPGPKLKVHYERLSGEEPGAGPTLVIRTADGNEHETLGGFGPFQGKRKAGDIVVDLGFRGRPGNGTPKNLEVYFIHKDRRWEDQGFRPRFKVSNSVVLGEMGRPLQYAREWKADEAAKLNNPPATAPALNANKNVGEDTDFVGNTMGLLPPMRYADPTMRPVIGILYRVGEGEPDKGKKVKCLVHLTPAYDKNQPRYGQEALFAKPGYAVGALNVKTKKVVTAVQVVFMKQKPDGTLDPADNYTSKWVGHPEEGDQEGRVSGEGRKVIGMHLKHFGIVHAVALVLE
jgi:hypothetical protein